MEVSGRKVDEILCEPCGDNGQKLSAVGFCVDCCEFLCSLCYQHHCRARAYRNHVLQDKEAMPRTKPDLLTTQTNNKADKCLKHRGEIIKFYCRSDCQLGCGSCMTVNHRKCDEIISIEEEYEKFDKEIRDFGLQIDKNSQTKDHNSIEIEKQHSQAVKDIKHFIKDIKDYFENLENKMISDVEKVKSEDEKKMYSISATSMTLRKNLQSLTSDISNLYQTQQNGKLFTKIEEARNQIKAIEKDIGMNNGNKLDKYTFVPEKLIEDLIRNVTSLGKLDIDVEPNQNGQTEILESFDEINTTLHETENTSTDSASQKPTQTKLIAPHASSQTETDQAKLKVTSHETSRKAKATSMDNPSAKNATIGKSNSKLSGINNQTSPVMPDQRTNLGLSSIANPSNSISREITDFQLRQISEVSEITAKSTSDEETPWITGIALLPDDQLVFVDMRNYNVKLVNTKQNKIAHQLKFSSKPWDITAVNNNLVAVMVPGDRQIQLVSVSNSKLSDGQTIKAKGQCMGIVHKYGTLIVTYDRPGKTEIISMNGDVLKVIDKGPNGESLFVNPWHIAISPDNTHVYISDYGKHTVTCLTLDGKVKGVYKEEGFIYPRGLTVDKSGSVYVVCGYPYFYIHQISGDCSQGQELQGSALGTWSWSITYCHKEDKLYVGYDCFNSIKVIQLK